MAPGSRLQELTAKYMQNPRRYFVPLANEYRKSNDLDRAIALCREHLPSQPGHMSGHIVLGRAYFEKGDVDAAREVFLTSVELDDENLIALRHLGDIAKAHHQLNEARQWYARVLDADPQNEEIERLLQSLGTSDEQAAAGEAQVVVPVEPATLESGADVGEVRGPAGADLGMALADPTPPGLRAITGHSEEFASSTDETAATQLRGAELAPDPRVPLDRFDLSTLTTEESAPLETEIRVDDGVGFIFDDLDELVDPAAGSATGFLPPVDEADFSAGIATPTSPATSVPAEPVEDEILSRPAFGALASFASWRTAQGRETPTNPTAQPTPSSPTSAQPPEPIASDAGLFWQPATADATSTAPEFITETMAALYEQQGFTQQALDVYQALLVRTPADVSLRAKVAEMRAVLAARPGAAALKADADSALDFDGVGFESNAVANSPEVAADQWPPSSKESLDDQELSSAFTSAWEGPESADGDWFADAPDTGVPPESGAGSQGIYGVTSDVFGIPARAGDGVLRPAAGAVTALASVFGSPAVVAADESASELLQALAAEMVGRLPKESPTLPVPDVLDLPSPVAGDEAAGTSPAPLLSFDRFFSGSGAPPRARPDTPVSSLGVSDPWQSPVAAPAPSLSPTFGGLPVIPPATVTPATWAAFDQFLPTPVRTPSSTPADSVPAAAVVPASRASVPVPAPSSTPGPAATPHPVATPLPNPVAASAAPADVSTRMAPAAAEPPSDVPATGEPARAAPSDFHRWLEGLS